MCVCDQGPPAQNGTVGGVSRTAQVHSGSTKIAVGSILGYYKFSKMWGKRTGPLGHSVRSYNPPVPSRPQRRPLPLGGLLLQLSINLHSAPADPTVLGFRLVHLLLFFGFSVILLLRYPRSRGISRQKSTCCSQSSYSPFLANVLILGGSDAHPCLRVLHACTGTCRYFIVRCPLLYYTDNIFTLCSFGRVLLCSAVLGPQGQTCIRFPLNFLRARY